MGSEYPYITKYGNVRSVKYPKFGGVRDVPFMDNNP